MAKYEWTMFIHIGKFERLLQLVLQLVLEQLVLLRLGDPRACMFLDFLKEE